MSIVHAFSNTVADATGTVTAWNGATTASVAATDIVRPSDWNSGHNQLYTLSGNTSNASTASGTNVVLQGLGGVTLVGSTGTIGISAAAAKRYSGFNPYADHVMITGQAGQGTLQLEPERFPELQFDRIVLPLSNSNASNSSGSHTLSFWQGLYTRNASTLSLLHSASATTAVTHSGTVGSYSLYSGMRLFTIPFTATLTEGEYWIANLSRTTSGGANGTYSQMVASNLASNFVGHFGSSNNTTMQMTLGQGVYTATTSGLPASIAFSQIRGSDSQAQRAPIVMYASGTA